MDKTIQYEEYVIAKIKASVCLWGLRLVTDLEDFDEWEGIFDQLLAEHYILKTFNHKIERFI